MRATRHDTVMAPKKGGKAAKKAGAPASLKAQGMTGTQSCTLCIETVALCIETVALCMTGTQSCAKLVNWVVNRVRRVIGAWLLIGCTFERPVNPC